MSRFLLFGSRPFPQQDLCAARLGADIDRARAFVESLRCWQLLDSYATGMATADQTRTVLVMRASTAVAAARVAAAWSQSSGFDVTVWPLVSRHGRGTP